MDRLVDDLDAFYLEHRRCGALDAGIEEGRVWITCDCGAALSRTTSVKHGEPLRRRLC
jgi:hypothetical protein